VKTDIPAKAGLSVRTFALACGLLASPRAQSSGGQNFVVVLPERYVHRRCLHRALKDGWCNRRSGLPGGKSLPPTEESPDVDRAEKKAAIATLNGVFKATNVVVVAHYSGLTVAQMQVLRRQMRQAGASVKVAKNRLAKIALEGTDVASIGSLLKGPTLIAMSSDPVAAPKVAIDFAKGHEKFVILGGAMGKTALDPNGVKALASLPSLDELRAKLVGLLVAPATKIAQLANAPAAKVARVVQAYASKGEAA
jgi:large subunit ribosomal protein L10